jgi:methyl-accepting chemotaxis protein
MQLGVRGKLLAGFGAVIFFLVLVGGIGSFSLMRVGHGLVSVVDVEMPGVIHVLEADVAAMQMQRDLGQLLFVSSAADQAKVREAYLAAEKSYEAELEALGKLLQSDEARVKLAELKQASGQWATARSKIVDAAMKQDVATASAIMTSDENTRNLASVNALLTSLVKMQEARTEAIGKAAEHDKEIALIITVLATLVATVVAAAIALVLAASIRNGVRDVQRVLTSMTDNCATALERALAGMAHGDLTIGVQAVTRPIERFSNDEIGQTARVTNTMLGKLKSTIEGYEAARQGLTEVVAQVQEMARGVSDERGERLSPALERGDCRAVRRY